MAENVATKEVAPKDAAAVAPKEEAPKATATRELEKKEYVRYYPPYGFASREINGAAWSSAGADSHPDPENDGPHPTIIWNEENDFRVPVERFSDAALSYIESDKDDGLEIVEE